MLSNNMNDAMRQAEEAMANREAAAAISKAMFFEGYRRGLLHGIMLGGFIVFILAIIATGFEDFGVLEIAFMAIVLSFAASLFDYLYIRGITS